MQLIRNTFRLSGRQHWDALEHNLSPIFAAPTEAAARSALDDLAEHWGERYPAIIRLWTNAWQEFIRAPRLRHQETASAVLHQRY